MATVRLENINKRYDNGAFAVIDFNLEINDREFLVLVGPSGCGKSTTLRMIAGLEEITTGSIYIDDTCVNNLPPKDRDISMVFQNYALYPHMTVYENLAFGLRLRKTPKKEIASRVDEAAAILGLGDFLKRLPKQLSGGQRQRVALGRALVRKPKVFLFDEPLSNLDAKMRVEMRSEINRLHNQLDATMIYVTHDQTEAMTLGDRIVVMDQGEIQQVSDPLSLYNTPENTFVAGFIGTPPMNLVAGGLVNRGGILGFRPESVTVLNKGDPAEKVIRCIIDFIEPMGCETYLHLNLSGKKVVARVPPENRYKCGDVIGLKIDFDKASFFNETTGKRVREKEVRECESA
ncbi:MAG: ATP-binding cassette domain-containing protein [Kiritimatiellae bacterium]|jgi:multiple sugar transport system ATP-binding protein|nr:ATP-binding cassette domain-containing protein [Kiritimatiellia bacterium]